MNDELSFLKNIHSSFYADGVSSMDSGNGFLKGRPFGGLGILWRKTFAQGARIIKSENDRIMSIEIDSNKSKILFKHVVICPKCSKLGHKEKILETLVT